MEDVSDAAREGSGPADGDHRKRKHRSERDKEKKHKSDHKSSQGGGDGSSDKVEKYKKLFLLKKKEFDELTKEHQTLKKELKRRDEQRTEDTQKNIRMRDEVARLKREVTEKSKFVQDKTIEVSKLTGKLDNVIACQELEKKQMEKSQDQGRHALMDDLKIVKAENQRMREHVEELQIKQGSIEEERRSKAEESKADRREEARIKELERHKSYEAIED